MKPLLANISSWQLEREQAMITLKICMTCILVTRDKTRPTQPTKAQYHGSCHLASFPLVSTKAAKLREK
jgi:hypothetical protein